MVSPKSFFCALAQQISSPNVPTLHPKHFLQLYHLPRHPSTHHFGRLHTVPEAHYNQVRCLPCSCNGQCPSPSQQCTHYSVLKRLICFHICPSHCIAGSLATREVFLFTVWRVVGAQGLMLYSSIARVQFTMART